jgi:membrane protease YdiL (CAAX protease family)
VLGFIRHHPLNLAIALAGAWLVGGLYEEMAFRGYVNRVFYNLSRGLSAARWLGLFVVSLLFGLYHWQQGILGILAAALGGIYWSCLIRWRGGNLWTAVFSHATYDTTALLLIYCGRF